MLLVPPSHSMAKTSAPYWDIHFVDAPGRYPPENMEELLLLLLAWHQILTLYPKACLNFVMKSINCWYGFKL